MSEVIDLISVEMCLSNRFSEYRLYVLPTHSITLALDTRTDLLFLSRFPRVEQIAPTVPWIKCHEPEGHLDEVVSFVRSLPELGELSRFTGATFKDGTILSRLSRSGYHNCHLVDPANDLGLTAKAVGVETLVTGFSSANVDRFVSRYGQSDVVFARHVLEHFVSPMNFLDCLYAMVRPGGYVIIEIPDCTKSINSGDCTMLWEEHLFYFTEYSIVKFLQGSRFSVQKIMRFEYALEDCLVLVLSTNAPNNTSIVATEPGEASSSPIARSMEYPNLLNARSLNVKAIFDRLRALGRRVVVYGAGHLSFGFVTFYKIHDVVDFYVDDDSDKHGYYTPTGHQVHPSSHLKTSQVGAICLLGLNPIHHLSISKRFQPFTESGGIFASIFPGTPLYLEEVCGSI